MIKDNMARPSSKTKSSSNHKSSKASLGTFKSTARVKKAAREPKSRAALNENIRDIFGPGTPSRLLRMNQTGNILSTEIIAYLPNWLRSRDVIRRLVDNGGNPRLFTQIANYYRNATKGYFIKENSVRNTIRNMMRECGFEDWTTTAHQSGRYRRSADDYADPTSLTLTGCQPQTDNSHGPKKFRGPMVDNVPFRSLATNVKYFPSIRDGEGLDLTLCLQYACANPEYDLLFPRDFDFVTRLCGGPLLVEEKHLDGSRFEQWTTSPPDASRFEDEIQNIGNSGEFVFTEDQKQRLEEYLDDVNAQDGALDTSPISSHTSTHEEEQGNRSESPSPPPFQIFGNRQDKEDSLEMLPSIPMQDQVEGISCHNALGWTADGFLNLSDKQVSLSNGDFFFNEPAFDFPQEVPSVTAENSTGYMCLQQFNQNFHAGFQGIMNNQPIPQFLPGYSYGQLAHLHAFDQKPSESSTTCSMQYNEHVVSSQSTVYEQDALEHESILNGSFDSHIDNGSHATTTSTIATPMSSFSSNWSKVPAHKTNAYIEYDISNPFADIDSLTGLTDAQLDEIVKMGANLPFDEKEFEKTVLRSGLWA